MLAKMLRDIEKLKEPSKDSTEIFNSILVAEQLEVSVSATLSEPIVVTPTVGNGRVGFAQVV